MSRIAFISLEPDARLASLVSGYKRRVRQLVGDQLYLSDPPHTTLYLAAFDSFTRLARAFLDVAARIEPIAVELNGWHVFSNDALTGKHTLVCQWSEASQEAARRIQSKVIDALSPLRNLATTEKRFAARWDSLSSEQRRSVQLKGFPYTGEAWHPHLTIASIEPRHWDASYGALREEPPQITGQAVGLKLYELAGNRPQAMLSAPFRARRAVAA